MRRGWDRRDKVSGASGGRAGFGLLLHGGLSRLRDRFDRGMSDEANDRQGGFRLSAVGTGRSPRPVSRVTRRGAVNAAAEAVRERDGNGCSIRLGRIRLLRWAPTRGFRPPGSEPRGIDARAGGASRDAAG